MMTIQLSGIKKIYQIGDQEVAALNGIDLHIESQRVTALCGPSGSGKSTTAKLLANRLGLGYLDPDSVDVADWTGHEDDGVLVVPRAGEVLYRLAER